MRQSDGRRVVFGRDSFPDIAAAVTASCAIPGVFRPEVINGTSFVDARQARASTVRRLARADSRSRLARLYPDRTV